MASVNDLIELGLWERRRRRLLGVQLTRADGARLEGVAEPLPLVDRLLSEATREARSSDLRVMAAWIAQQRRSAPLAVVTRTVEALTAGGLLEREPQGRSTRLVPTARGIALVGDAPATDRRAERPRPRFSFSGGAAIGAVWAAGCADGTAAFVTGAGHHGGSVDHGGGGHGGDGHHG